jgi:hypothetical protein
MVIDINVLIISTHRKICIVLQRFMMGLHKTDFSACQKAPVTG